MVYAHPRICPGEWHAQTFLGYWGTNGHLISTRRVDVIIINEKERICRIGDFVVPTDHRLKLKESEKRDKYLALAKELKKTVEQIVIGALVTDTKGLVQGMEDLDITGWVETVQTTALLRLTRILRIVLETWEDLRRLAVP